ncbi:MAG: acetylglutamate kinase [Alicyclobacillus sp.]|nr:acetylglutamate kinase [Alicyclobacillus sp.]
MDGNRIVVLKVGGSLGTEDWASVVAAVRWLRDRACRAIVVHGGGPRISAALQKVGLELPFVDGQRRTTAEAMPVVAAVLRQVNAELVNGLESSGIPAVGLTEADGLLQAQPQVGMERTAVVGAVNTARLTAAWADGRVPVAAPVAMDDAGAAYNVNADLAAGAVAAAVQAERIVFLTDVDGIYSDFAAKVRLDAATDVELDDGLAAGWFTGGMRPKVAAVQHALRGGVPAAFVVGGQHPEGVLWAVGLALDDEQRKPGSAKWLGTCVRRSRLAVNPTK